MTNPRKPEASYILVNKPAGITSFEALYPVKKALGTKKAGHTGTLDKAAEGLLIVLTGGALKLSRFFTGLDKKYIAGLRFGEERDTLDAEGRVIAVAPPPSERSLLDALPDFTGTIWQTPPEFSAVHIDGKRAYKIALEGKKVEMKARKITIYSLKLLSYESPLAEIEVSCSSGTYIRSLARDIGRSVSSRASLYSLLRTDVGDFSLKDAVNLTENEEGARKIREAARKIEASLFDKLSIPVVEIDGAGACALKNGADVPRLEGMGLCAVFSDGEFIKVYDGRRGGAWHRI